MLNIDKLDGQILTQILFNRSWPDDQTGYTKVAALQAHEALEYYLRSKGIVGYATEIISVLDNLRNAEAAAEWKEVDITEVP